jgi:hypothetical protein
MKLLLGALIALLALPIAVKADENKVVKPLGCGIYDQLSRPLVEKDMDTQSHDRARYTMELRTSRGRRLMVEVQSVSIRLAGEREHVSIFLDGKPYAKTSHQDVPLYLEVHIDDKKYRVICVREASVIEIAKPGLPLVPENVRSLTKGQP